MSPVKSALFGMTAGLIAYLFAANVGGIVRHGGEEELSAETALVSVFMTPSATKVSGDAKSFDTKVTPSAKSVTPSVTSVGTTVASVTPRPTAAVLATSLASPATTPHGTPTPTPTPIIPRANTPTPTPAQPPTPTSTPTPTLTPTPTPTPVGSSKVVINEIAWAGTAASATDEWFELYNAGTAAQNLAGWNLCAGTDKVVAFTAAHSIPAGGYFIAERTDDTTVSDILGDYVGPFSKALVDTGLLLTLRSGSCADGAVVDTVGPGAWYAGNSAQKATMERISADAAGDLADNWATWGTVTDGDGSTISTGLDALGTPLHGTPKYQNSVSN